MKQHVSPDFSRLFVFSLLLSLFLLIGACTGNPLDPSQCSKDMDCAATHTCKDSYCVKRPPLTTPAISTVFPRKAKVEGRLTLVVRGQGFLKTSVLLFNGVPIKTDQSNAASELFGDLPRPSDGIHKVQVRQKDGTTSLEYLLNLAKAPVVEKLSFARAIADCKNETLVVWGNNFWENIAGSLRSKADKTKEFAATSVEQKSATEVHLHFDFSVIPKGEYELVLHNGFPANATLSRFAMVDKLPAAKLLNLSPRRFWLGTTSTAFVVGLNLKDALVFFDDKPIRLFDINRSTSSLLLDLSKRSKDGQGRLVVRNACSNDSSDISVELLGVPTPQLKTTKPAALKLVDEDDVILEGDKFHPKAQLWIDNQPRPTALRTSNTQFLIPRTLFPADGTYKIQVVNPGDKKSRVFEFKVSHTPTITRITPTYLSRTAAQKVTIEGNNFGSSVRVRIDGKVTDEIEIINDTRLLLSSSLFPKPKTYTVEVENSGDKVFRSKSIKHTIKAGPRIQQLNPPLVLIPLSEGELQIIGNDFDEKAKVLIDGKVAEKYTYNEGVMLIPVDLLKELGEHTLQVVNSNGEKSNIVKIPTSKIERIALQEIKEVGELAYLCGVGVREEANNRPRAVFKQGGKTLLEVELFISTFDTKCLYFNTSEIRFLAEGPYQVQLCRDDVKGTDCSNHYPWQWRGLPDTEPPSKSPPQLEWVRLLNPLSPVIAKDKQPANLTFVIGGKHLRGTREIRFNGKKLDPKGDFRFAILANQIIVYNMPLPTPLYGTHAIEVVTTNGRSNTTFLRFDEKPFVQVYWTPQLFLPRDGDFNFQFYGSQLATNLGLWMDGKAVTLGSKALAWSQFASQAPFFLSSFAWNEAKKQTAGLKEVWLQSKDGLKSNKLVFPVRNSDQWGQEPLRLVAVDEPTRYQNSAGLAPASGETVTLRLAYTGFQLASADGKTKGSVLINGKATTFTPGTTSLLGYSTISIRATRFTGTPRLIPLQLKNPDGKLSNIQFVTVVPPNSFRLTKIYNAADFSSILRPSRKTELQIHGRGVTKEMKVYFAGQKLEPTLYYKNPETNDEFIRVEIAPGDLPSGQYPIWAVKDNTTVSNSLLVTVARAGVGGVPRLRSINPMVWPKKALSTQGHKVRVLIDAVGLTADSKLVLDGKEIDLVQQEGDRAYAVVDVSSLSPGSLTAWIKNGETKTFEFKLSVTD